jgi:hypothetical protein
MATNGRELRKEAACLLQLEGARFVPFSQAPFARFYSAEERALLCDKATTGGNFAPFSVICRSYAPRSDR